LKYRGLFDNTADVTNFATTLERVCTETVEAGHMTKDLAILIGPEQKWLSTNALMDQIDKNLKNALQ
jgi:isocitrate dehydrogenase